METFKSSVLLRVYIGEADKIHGELLYEHIVFMAKEAGLAGATVLHGIMNFGHHKKIHSVKLFDIATNLPAVVEIVDDKEKIDSFLEPLQKLLTDADCGCMLTVENVQMMNFVSTK
jgi:hypothetical protein